MIKLDISLAAATQKEIFGVCRNCHKEVKRLPYDGYYGYIKAKSSLLKITECPHCQTMLREHKSTIKWERTPKGDYIAKCKNGDFLVFKWGNVWKWRYRPYGQTHPDVVRTAKTKDLAKRACERHEEFRQ